MKKGFTLIELIIVAAIIVILGLWLFNAVDGRRVTERCLHGQIYLYDAMGNRYIGPKLTTDGRPISCGAERGQ